MSGRLIIVGALFLAFIGTAFADSSVASAQKALKDQGFYYGEVTGTKDADTTAAIRRYQIRNGLQVTGDLNAETLKSLGMTPGASSAATPSPRSTPPARVSEPDTSDLRDDGADVQQPRRAPGQAIEPPDDSDDAPEAGYGPAPRGTAPAEASVLAGTPYETAPIEVQRQVIAAAQALLARRGYYRSIVDGLYGPGTEFALRAYQTRFGLVPSGRLDVETLASFWLLPEQRGPGLRRRPRIWRGPPVIVPPGERIYIPR